MRFTNGFRKDLRKLNALQKKRVSMALRLFRSDPFAESLRNHPLKGDKQGIRSFSAAFDLRILYLEQGKHAIVFLLEVGSHDKVY